MTTIKDLAMKVQEVLDNNKEKMTDQEYLEACNNVKKLYEKKNIVRRLDNAWNDIRIMTVDQKIIFYVNLPLQVIATIISLPISGTIIGIKKLFTGCF